MIVRQYFAVYIMEQSDWDLYCECDTIEDAKEAVDAFTEYKITSMYEEVLEIKV